MPESIQDVALAKGIELFDAVSKQVVEAAPQVVALAEGAMRVSGLQSLSIGMAAGIIAIIFNIAAVKTLNKRKVKEDEWDHPVPWILSIISLTGYLTFLINVLDIWEWIAVIQPKLAIANKLFNF